MNKINVVPKLTKERLDEIEKQINKAMVFAIFKLVILSDRISSLAAELEEELKTERVKIEEENIANNANAGIIKRAKKRTERVLKYAKRLTEKSCNLHLDLCKKQGIDQFFIADLTTRIEAKSNQSIKSLQQGTRKYLRMSNCKEYEIYSMANALVLEFLIAGYVRICQDAISDLKPIKLHRKFEEYLRAVMGTQRASESMTNILFDERGVKTLKVSDKDMTHRFIEYIQKSCDEKVIRECILKTDVGKEQGLDIINLAVTF